MIIPRVLMSAAAAAVLGAQMSGAAQASAVTYNLSLTNTKGPENGTGSFTVNGPIASTGIQNFTAGSGLVSMDFLIDGNDFKLSNAFLGADVTFSNGNLINIAYAGALGGITFDLDTLRLGYRYFDFNNLGHDSAGIISAAATPLPPTWTMMLTGLVGFGVMMYRRKARDTLVGAVPA
jgi:hypothetical protein